MFTKKKMAAVVAGLAVVGTSGVAFGYWTNAGSGSGTAATGTNAAITVNQTVDSSAPALYPGGPARTLSGTFTNPNPGKVYVANVTANSVTTDKAGCTAADYTLGGTAPVNAEVASGTGVGAWTGLTLTMNNTAVNQDACKGATVTISYTSN